MGDSAGGAFAMLTVQSLISQGLDVPRGIVAFSPWTDLSASGESYRRNKHKDVMFTDSNENDDSMLTLFLGSNPLNLTANHPMISPLFGSFKGFPPMFITVGTAELFEDDSSRILIKAQNENVDITYEAGKHLMHIYPLFYQFFPEARQTLMKLDQWLKHLDDRK